MAQTRITAGELRGRQVLTPAGRELRPTTSLVRQALFNILGDSVPDAVFIDLFAGTGSVGFEAISRGASRVVFVERDRAAVELIRATARRLGCEQRCRIAAADALTFLRREATVVESADIAYVDAPYRDDVIDDALRLCGEHPPALLVCEHHRARVLPESSGRLRRSREVGYGATRLSFFRREPMQAET
ncbi:MAG TPA: 16S rRNA (guanine(966)-N(2))-methyltransferase RsmD [Candidatus Dormibacteraeota bacterium]|jgi:16S rRNA (guanine(966)-N(2))-methyltransferase RsmD|nr:16S rRNA (guanine(966)-N(2))-methyltransferase RsmD [Candidatus Dormibacteraeota bacterium]